MGTSAWIGTDTPVGRRVESDRLGAKTSSGGIFSPNVRVSFAIFFRLSFCVRSEEEAVKSKEAVMGEYLAFLAGTERSRRMSGCARGGAPFCLGVGLGCLLGVGKSRRIGWYGAMGVVDDTMT